MSLDEGFSVVLGAATCLAFADRPQGTLDPKVSSSGFASITLLASCHCATGDHAYFCGESWP